MESVNRESKRKLNLEILRIISMIWIILHHYALHGGLFSIENNYIGKYIAEFIIIGGKLGVNLFVLISAYFLIDSKFKSKKILKLWLEVIFYSYIFGFIGFVIDKNAVGIKQIIKTVIPVLFGEYWFITTYIIMYILSPWTNKLIKSLNKEEHKNLLIILSFVFIIIKAVPGTLDYLVNNFVWFEYLYLLIAYYKIYNVQITSKKSNSLVIGVLSYLAVWIISVVCTILSSKFEIFNKGINYFGQQNSIFIVVSSIMIFDYFKRLNINDNNKVIEFFANSSLAVYLVHEQTIFRNVLWNKILKTSDYYYLGIIQISLHIVLSCFIIYLSVSIIDFIRRKFIENKIINKLDRFNKYFKKINNVVNMEQKEKELVLSNH